MQLNITIFNTYTFLVTYLFLKDIYISKILCLSNQKKNPTRKKLVILMNFNILFEIYLLIIYETDEYILFKRNYFVNNILGPKIGY